MRRVRKIEYNIAFLIVLKTCNSLVFILSEINVNGFNKIIEKNNYITKVVVNFKKKSYNVAVNEIIEPTFLI